MGILNFLFGGDEVSELKREERVSMCKYKCDAYYKTSNKCSLCFCDVDEKAKYKSESCPQNPPLWPKEN